MAYDGELIFNTKIDPKDFNKGVNALSNKVSGATENVQSSIGGLSGAFGKLGKTVAVAFSVAKIAQFCMESITLASDMQEVQNVVDTAFGSMAYKMEQFADAAVETYGISKLTAKRTGSTLMAMATGMDIAQGSASDMAIALTGLSADMASFYNIEQEIASTALKSIFTGETETLKQFGIVMTEANLEAFALSQGITKSVSAMTQAEKVQLRYSYVTKQTSLAQGDFARTSEGWANQTRALSEKWKEFASNIGAVLMRLLLPIVQSLNDAMSAALIVIDGFMDALGLEPLKDASGNFDSFSNSAEDAASAAGEVEDGICGVGKAARKELIGIDEINRIGDGLAGGNLGGTTSNITQAAEAMCDAISTVKTNGDEAETDACETLDNISTRLNKFLFGEELGEKWNRFWEDFGMDIEQVGLEGAVGNALSKISRKLTLWAGPIGNGWFEFWEDFGMDIEQVGLEGAAGNALSRISRKLTLWAGPFGRKWTEFWEDIGIATEEAGIGLNLITGTMWARIAIDLGKKTASFAIDWFRFWEGLGIAIEELEIGAAVSGILEKIEENVEKWTGPFKETWKKFWSDIVDICDGITSGGKTISWQEASAQVSASQSSLPHRRFPSAGIPRYATGTVVPANFGEFISILGDNKREPEIVSPYSTMKQAFLDALSESSTANSSGGTTVIKLVCDGRMLAEVVNKHKNRTSRSTNGGGF